MKIKDISPLCCQVNTGWWSISRLQILEDCKSLIDLGKLYLGEQIKQPSSMDQNCLGASLPKQLQNPLNDCFLSIYPEMNCASYSRLTGVGYLLWVESIPYLPLDEAAYPLKPNLLFLFFFLILNDWWVRGLSLLAEDRISVPSTVSCDTQPVTLGPEAPESSSSLHGHLHTQGMCSPIHMLQRV